MDASAVACCCVEAGVLLHTIKGISFLNVPRRAMKVFSPLN